MDDRKKERLIERYIDGRLTRSEREAFAALRARDPDFDARVVDARAVEAAFADAPDMAFRPSFAARVMDRVEHLEDGAEPDFATMLSALFPRFVSPVAVVAAVVMVRNYSMAAEGTPFVEALFGIQPTMHVLLLGS